jgi:hypothetical protein
VPVRWACRTGVCHTCETGLIIGAVGYQPEPVELPAVSAARAAPSTLPPVPRRRFNVGEGHRLHFLIARERSVWIEAASLREGVQLREVTPLIWDFEGDLAA